MADEDRSNFLTDIIDADLASGRHVGVVTRFPPEPNGYLHIGHAKSICLNYGLAQRYEGHFNLRFDDTNPEAEEDEFVQGIIRDVKWLLGLDELETVLWASDYFEQMYGFAVELVQKGLAYVDSQTVEQVREGRGDFTTPGTKSPYRDRSVEENLDLLARMRAGEFGDGAHTLRARIDMAHPNMVMRDPLLYRIKHANHHNTGDEWCIYPMYDFAHCLEDAIEGITHSICTLEFENNRELYDWILDNVSVPARPHQYEFARLALEYTVMSKRMLRMLVEEGHVDGWDDPRMPTVAGLRRRGVRADAIRQFADMIGVAKTNSTVDFAKLEFAIRDDLNSVAPRTFAVLDPVRLVLTNVAPDAAHLVDAPLFPDDPYAPFRVLAVRRELLVERSDFAETPPDGWRRLAPGASVRLRHAGSVRCDSFLRNDEGEIIEIRGTLLDDENAPDGLGVIHWLAEADAVPAEVRLYEQLFDDPDPAAATDVEFHEGLNSESLVVCRNARVEPWLRDAVGDAIDERGETADPGLRVQFERTGYFAPDIDATADRLVFNRIVTLKDSWAKQIDTSDEDLDVLRARKEKEKAEQAARSEATRRDPAAVAASRGSDVAREFAVLAGAGVGEHDALAVASAGPDRVTFLTGLDAFSTHPAEAASYVVNLVLPSWDDAGPPYPAAEFSALLDDVVAGEVSGGDAKRAHAHMLRTGTYDRSVVARLSSAELLDLVREVVADHPDEVAKYKEGRHQLMGFFIGQVMSRAGGGADAGDVRTLLAGALGG